MSFLQTPRMDASTFSSNRYLNLSDRTTAFQPGSPTNRTPSPESVIPSEENGTYRFENIIPEDPSKPTDQRTKRKYRKEFDAASDSSGNTIRPQSLVSTIVWPTLIITIPIAGLCATLLGTVYGCRVRSRPNLFAVLDSENTNGPASYILVRYSATRLVFIASFLSSLAPVLTGFIMTLWTLPIAQSMWIASTTRQYTRLPTPYQLSLIIGTSLASYERLWTYFGYLLSRNRSTIPRVLHGAAAMFSCAIVLALAVFATDTYLHYTTQTISFDEIADPQQIQSSYGRGLDQYCLDFNRKQNYGFPCSYDPLGKDPNFSAQQNELFYLQHNMSDTSEIRFVSSSNLPHGDLALLAPQSRSIPSGVDFRASTVGVSSQCRPISTECDMRYGTDDSGYHTLFNCSENFWGILGKPPIIADIAGDITPDASISDLAYKPAANLQYAFFVDEGLNTIYNSVGYDPKTFQSTMAATPAVYSALSDADLINPIQFAMAGRFSFSAESAGLPLNSDPGIFVDPDGSRVWADFVLQCSLTSYEVDYTWVQGSVQNASFVPTSNGSLLEIFHGSQFYVSVNGGGFDLQDYMLQAALQNTSEQFAKTWANLYSTKILSTMGAFSSSRGTAQEQSRTQLLVAKVQISALAALVACSLAYTVLGIALGISAYRASAIDVRDIAAQLSLPGLTEAAFGGKSGPPGAEGSQGHGSVFSERLVRKETRRVAIDGSPDTGYDFRVWV